MDCIFCQIAAGDIPAEVVYRDEELIAFKDINPLAPVHLLLIPSRHIESLNELKKEDIALAGKIQLLAVRLANKFGISETGYRLLTNCGSDSGQEVKHLHYHLLGGHSLGLGN